MKTFRFVVALAIAAGAAAAPVVYTPVVSLGPNPYGSPSYDAYVASVIGALEADTSGGQPWSNAVSAPSRNDILETDYSSWLGVAGATGPDGVAFGTALFTGVHIVDDQGTFTLANLYVHQYSSDPYDYWEYQHNYDSDVYAPNRVGIWYGPDGIKGTADDVIYSNGEASTMPINELAYVGISAGFPAMPEYGYSPDQAGLDQAAADLGSLGQYTITTAYSEIPEPATGAPGAAVLAGLFLLRRRV